MIKTALYCLSNYSKTFCRIFILILVLSGSSLKAQVDSTKDENEVKPIRLPIVSLGIGRTDFSGDVGYSRLNQPFMTRSGFQITIQQATDDRFSFALFLLSGKVFGEEKTIRRSLNFQSSIVSEGLLLRYDFKSKKRMDQVLVPFLTAGIEYLNFHSRSDMTDANGQKYNYWSDGTIRNIAQDDPAADQSVRIYRDYTYETDLRDANLDGFGKYKSNTWSLPVGAGFRFNISNRFSMDLSSTCHLTGSDLIDGVTAESKGNRQGNSKKDNIFFTAVSINFALSSGKDTYKNVDFNALVNEDADGDGIPDIADDSSGTPKNNAVGNDGKPFDHDNDGIPDYRDKELNSSSDAVVNVEGVTITEEMIEEKFRKDSLAALPAVIEYLEGYDKLTKRNPSVEKKWIEKNSEAGLNVKPGENPIPAIYRILDKDNNYIITPKEISLAIDDYLAKRSPYNVSQFFDLIDFFFSQN